MAGVEADRSVVFEAGVSPLRIVEGFDVFEDRLGELSSGVPAVVQIVMFPSCPVGETSPRCCECSSSKTTRMTSVWPAISSPRGSAAISNSIGVATYEEGLDGVRRGLHDTGIIDYRGVPRVGST